jgi:hypothetical protein
VKLPEPFAVISQNIDLTWVRYYEWAGSDIKKFTGKFYTVEAAIEAVPQKYRVIKVQIIDKNGKPIDYVINRDASTEQQGNVNKSKIMNEETIRDRTPLMKAIENIINSQSWENEANVPDFILAEFLTICFNAFNDMIKKRDKWYSVHLEPCNSYFEIKKKG